MRLPPALGDRTRTRYLVDGRRGGPPPTVLVDPPLLEHRRTVLGPPLAWLRWPTGSGLSVC